MKRGIAVTIGQLYGVALGVAVLLTGCNRDPGPTPPTPPTPHVKALPAVKRGPSPEELTAGMVEAVTMGKSNLPVAVKFDLPERPVVGRPVEVVIAVMPQISADRAELSITTSDQLALPAGAGEPIDMDAVEPDQVYRHSVKVTPAAEGVQLLGLNVSIKHDDITETRVFSIPLIVAGAGDGAAVGPKTGSGGVKR